MQNFNVISLFTYFGALGKNTQVVNEVCKEPCTALFWKTPLRGPWKAIGAQEPYEKWFARGGYDWELMLTCEEPVTAEKNDKIDTKQAEI